MEMSMKIKGSAHHKQNIMEFLAKHARGKNVSINDLNKYFYLILSGGIDSRQMLITINTSEYVYKVLTSTRHNFSVVVLSLVINSVCSEEIGNIKTFISKKSFDMPVRKMIYKNLYIDLFSFLQIKKMVFLLDNIGGVLDYYYVHKQ